jgi:hypothetical protein
MRIKHRSLAIAIPLIVVLCCMVGPYTLLGVSEYLRPTTAEMVRLPEGCVESGETAPAELMKLVERQREWYGLTLQTVVVCKIPHPLGTGRPGLTEGVFDSTANRRWLPNYFGCCTFTFRRHFIVEAAMNTPNEATVVLAAMIQSRSSYWHTLGWNTGLKFRLWMYRQSWR